MIRAYSNNLVEFIKDQLQLLLRHHNNNQRDDTKEEYSEWHNLPNDILGNIINLLNVWDLAHMSCTCKSWRSSLLLFLANGFYPQHPWLVRPTYTDNSDHNLMIFIDLFDKDNFRTLKLPLSRIREGHWCCGSSNSWLLIAYGPKLQPDLILLNPISGQTHPLPPLYKFDDYYNTFIGSIDPKRCNPACFIRKITLSKSSPVESDCIVAALTGMNNVISFCTVGGDSWTLFEVVVPSRYCPDELIMHFEDILFSVDGTTLYVSSLHSGNYYLCGTRARLIQPQQTKQYDFPIFDGDISCSRKISLFQAHPELVLRFALIPITDHGGLTYLVETSKGKLLEVHKFESRSSRTYYLNTRFHVFSVDLEKGRRCRLDILEDEDDDVIFVGGGGCSSLSSRDFKDGLIRGNCINFLLDRDCTLLGGRSRDSCESGAFDLKTGKVISSMPNLSHLFWFTPNPF